MQQWCASPVVLGDPENVVSSGASRFLAIGETVKSLQRVAEQKDAAWIAYMSKQGHASQLLFIETSARACLSVKADMLLRAIEVATKFMDSASGMADLLKSDDDNHISLEPEQVREFSLRFVQVISVEADQLVKAGFDKASDMQQMIKAFMNRTLCKLVDACTKIKKEIGETYAKYEKAVDIATKWDIEGISSLKATNNDAAIKSLHQGVGEV